MNRTIFYIRIFCSAAVKLLGVLLLVAAALKAWDLTRSHIPRTEVWEIAYNVFIICQIGFEVFLGVWLISGLFKKLAVKVAMLCFVVFFIVTMWKVGIGSKTCGCFGPVEVAPLVTLLAIDLPAIIILALFGLLPDVAASPIVAVTEKDERKETNAIQPASSAEQTAAT